MMLDILGKVEFVHDDGHHSDHPGINGSHMPRGVTTLTRPGDYVVGGVQLESLNLNTMTISLSIISGFSISTYLWRSSC